MTRRYEETDTEGPVRALPPGTPLDEDTDPADDESITYARLVLGEPWATALVVAGTPDQLTGYAQRVVDAVTGVPTAVLPARQLAELLAALGDHPGALGHRAKAALRALRATPRVGLPDPTPIRHPGRLCEHPCHPHGLCSWPTGHDGDHAAGNGELIIGVAGPTPPASDEGSPQ